MDQREDCIVLSIHPRHAAGWGWAEGSEVRGAIHGTKYKPYNLMKAKGVSFVHVCVILNVERTLNHAENFLQPTCIQQTTYTTSQRRMPYGSRLTANAQGKCFIIVEQISNAENTRPSGVLAGDDTAHPRPCHTAP